MKEWEALRVAAAPQRKYWENGLAHTPQALRPLARVVLDALDAASPPPRDPELHGAILALLAPKTAYDSPARYDEVSALHVALGVDFAIEALVASLRFSHLVASSISIYTQQLAWIDVAPPEAHTPLEPLIALRAALRASRVPLDRAVAAALAAREHAPPALRFGLAWLLPDEPRLFTADDEAYGLTCDDDPGMTYDLAWLRHVDLGLAVSKTSWGLENEPDSRVAVEHLGAKALPLYRRYVVLGAWDPEGVAVAQVAATGGVAALRVLAEAAHREKEVLPSLLAAALADPPAAAAAIAGLLAAPPRRKKVRRAPPPLTRPILEAVQGMVAPADAEGPVADPSELPAVLASPPWVVPKSTKAARGKSASAKGAAPPAAVAHEERLVWGKRDPASLFAVDAADEEQTLARLKEDGDGTFFLHTFMWLTDETALRLLREIPPARWYGAASDLEALLARFGLAVLDSILAYVRRQPDRFAALLPVDSPRVATLAAHQYATSKKNHDVAEAWLKKHPRAATAGLAVALATEKGKARESVEKALAFVHTQAPAVVDEVLALAGATALAEETRSEVASKPVKAPKLPPFVDLATLPTVRTQRGARLPAGALASLVGLLAISDRRAPRPDLLAALAALDPASLDRFAWALFVPWLAAGGPPKQAFGLDVLGLCGSPATLRTLAEAARAWAPGGLPQRAQAAVDVLALARGTAGLGAIHRLTQVRSRALASHAEKVLAATARARGIAKEDLVDQLVPDLGLEADGTLHFDYGTRSFTLAFDAEMQPYLLDAQGKKLVDLPKPAGAEEEIAAPLVAQWKEIKRRAKEIVREQSRRLELALATERRFSYDHFEASFAGHPLLQHLARRLVWGAYRDDALALSFRVAEDGTLADVEDGAVVVPHDLRVGLVHPLRLDDELVRRWGSRFADYQILQPFEQLARTTYTATEAERAATSLDRVAGREVATGKVVGLDRLGWVRTDPVQGGRVHAWQKVTRIATALLTLEPGIYLGAPQDDPRQTLGPILVLAPRAEGGEQGDDEVVLEPTPLAAIDRVFFSELVRDLETLAAP